MKPNLLSSAALVVLSTNGVLSKDSSSANGLRDAFDTMADAAKAKFAGLSDHAAVGGSEEPELSASAFGTSLFSEVCEEFPSGNVLLSPLSVHKALALVKDGATIGSENEAELKQLLGSSSSIEQTSEDGECDVQLSIATSIWANRLKQSYVDGAVENHSAEAFPLPDRYTPVDDWIEKKTNGMIKGFLGDDELDGDIEALLVNAVYFKGAWTYEFDPKDTVDGDFTLRDESKSPAKFMTATFKMCLLEKASALGGASAVMLDYGNQTSDGEPAEFASIFILPATPDTDSMNDVITGLNSQSIEDLMDRAWKTNAKVVLPRFRLEFGPEKLKPSLEDMGMKIAFDDRNQNMFDEMSGNPGLYVGDVLHGAVMEVTEAGTEAAAATVVPMRSRSMPRAPPEITFDRPFVVVVIHKATGEPVFMGRVEEPVLIF
mmetsp:Transcript_13425/g.29154  ORF Transcript_13425/g.29154 Transcript_13425/m.29154 type:complete len:432 (+) Transcript_13425:111-1406(+)